MWPAPLYKPVAPKERACQRCPSDSKDLFWKIKRVKNKTVVKLLCPSCAGEVWRDARLH